MLWDSFQKNSRLPLVRPQRTGRSPSGLPGRGGSTSMHPDSQISAKEFGIFWRLNLPNDQSLRTKIGGARSSKRNSRTSFRRIS
jgi:hypothetical protein